MSGRTRKTKLKQANIQNKLKIQYNISVWPVKRVNFWGVTKCGNTSVKTALIGDKKMLSSDMYNTNVDAHNPCYARYVDMNTALTNNYRNFTLVRNPYDRCLSMYKDFVLKRPEHLIKNHDANRINMTFDEFLQQILTNIEDDVHIRSQTSFLLHDGELAVNNIFKLENIKPLELFLGIKLPHLNKTKGDVQLSDTHMEIIHKIYKKDFVYLDYSR